VGVSEFSIDWIESSLSEMSSISISSSSLSSLSILKALSSFFTAWFTSSLLLLLLLSLSSSSLLASAAASGKFEIVTEVRNPEEGAIFIFVSKFTATPEPAAQAPANS